MALVDRTKVKVYLQLKNSWSAEVLEEI